MRNLFSYNTCLKYNVRYNSTYANKTKEHSIVVKLSNSELKFSTGHLARLASGAVELRQNENAVSFVFVKYK